MRVLVTDACVGHGVCESLAPDLFEVGDDGIAHVLSDPVPENLTASAGHAVAACPAQALLLDHP